MNAPLQVQLDQADADFRRCKADLVTLELERLRSEIVSRRAAVKEWRRAIRWCEAGVQDFTAVAQAIAECEQASEVFMILDQALRGRLRVIGERDRL